jgi:HNH endonuclease
MDDKERLRRFATLVLDALKNERSQFPKSLQMSGKVSAEVSHTRGYWARLATLVGPALHLEIWLDKFSGVRRYYAGFSARKETGVARLAKKCQGALGKPLKIVAEDLAWDLATDQDYRLKPPHRAEVQAGATMFESYPEDPQFFFGKYFPNVPASGSTVEAALSREVTQLFRGCLSEAGFTTIDSAGGKAFNPKSVKDGRRRIQATIVQRQGQSEFRNTLLSAYRRTCPVTGCTAVDVLEACHIYPYRGKQTNHVTNGLLLRSDTHTLFDLGRLRIHPQSLKVAIAKSLKGTNYEHLNGQRISRPDDPSLRPSKTALKKSYTHLGE